MTARPIAALVGFTMAIRPTGDVFAEPSLVEDKRTEFATALYADDAGLTVASQALAGWLRVGALELSADVVLDRVHQASADGHHGAVTTKEGIDIVTSASGRNVVGDHTRVEGSLGARYDFDAFEMGLRGRFSTEPGYLSGSATVAGATSFGDGATSLAASASYGHDVASSRLPDSEASFVRDRTAFDVAASQILTDRIVGAAGIGGAALFGELSTPDAMALYRSTALPEVVPDLRLRASTFVRLSAAVFEATAVHATLSGYADTWTVLALSPDARLACDLGDAVTLALGYRFYWQTAASFYDVLYLEKTQFRTGDV